MKTGTLLLYVYIFLLSGIGYSSAQEISFNHLTSKDGLSSNTVMSIYQDEKGFMWFGTRYGVNLYNGNKITVYKSYKDGPHILNAGGTGGSITGNGKGEIYIKTSQGISMFNTSRQRFTTLLKGDIGVMCYHKHLYITQKNRIYRYEGNQFVPFYELRNNRHSIITALHVRDEHILIGTEEDGLFRLNGKQEPVQLIPQGTVTNIFQDSTGKTWVGTWEHGFYLIDGTSIANFKHSETDPASVSSNFVRNFCEDKQGNIWIGTFNGLNRFNPSTRTFTCYKKQDDDNSLTHSSVWSLLCDNQGTVWVGTYYGGVNYFNPQNQIYRHFQESKTENAGLSASIIGCITEDSLHNIWIGTEGGGVTKYDPQSNTFQWYKHNGRNANSLSHDNVKSLCYDHTNETMWIGTHLGGLNRLDIRKGKFTHYYPGKQHKSPHANIIRQIVLYKDRLFLATHGGLYSFDPETERFALLGQKHSPQIKSAVSIQIDYQEKLWLSGNGEGVYTFEKSTGKIENHKHNHAFEHSISNNQTGIVYADKQKRIWLCSGSGIDLFQRETNDFENFNERKNGLGSNLVYGVCELSPDKMLFTTDIGFSILDYPTRRFTNYSKDNGFPLSAINENSVYKACNGDIYIGGLDGMVSFREENIDNTPQNYNIYPFSLSVNDSDIQTGDESGILQQPLCEASCITLKAGQRMFSIEYATTNYIPFNKDNLEYYLKGFSEGWTDMNELNNVTYTNLSPGKYTLIVRAKNNRLIPESRLGIEILPPFYLTMWAYLLYALCIGIVLYFIVRAYKKRIKLQESLRYEQKHTEDIERLNQAKLRFFTNISHEFRTPLTLIIGQMEMLLQARTFPPSIYNRILGVYKNCLHMRELITELLDFRKQEQGYMTIKVSEQNIVDFVYESYLLFQEYALQRQIAFKFNKIQDDIPLWYDKRQFQKVMSNLISNAFKHTQAGEEITVSVRKVHKEVVIDVSDTGSGIAPKDLEKIFDRFYQIDQLSAPSAGTGIGLALTKGIVELHHGHIEVFSKPGEGTTFSVYMQPGKAHFAAEQICDNAADSPIEKSVLPEIASLISEEQQFLTSDSYADRKQEIKILVVEDNGSLREMLVDIFTSFYRVITACNGEEGWLKVQSEHPHIVLSDVVMPVMSGTDLCKLIKNNIETCHIPVVLLTARTAVEHNLEGLRIGADDYITKPFNVNILLSRCNNLINNRIMLQEKFSNHPQETPQILATNAIDKELVDKAMAVIDKYMDNTEFNIDILAREMGISRTKLFNKLKDITGQTPYDFIVTIRLKRAAIMLKEHPELNISEISDKLGFSSPRQFSKSFKEKYNIAPQSYRKGEVASEGDEH
ncbi:two-component regulator propeller domain-containing protein [uncultured Bacteroides sp.]|uniref:hybrid sensor histidine kinase/response regulator transcription factor n=1 Tax=uncultured Bacteroides sp. TaxID=162156 RepID=UPI0025D83824|nr:two-component regulator propeller domain-containing protein [uncultured Bacteroides sp.]